MSRWPGPEVVAYAEFDTLWERFQPETPFGREARRAAAWHVDESALEALWDQTDAVLGFLAEFDQGSGDPVRLDRITHHLKRLPRFPESGEDFSEIELFQFKKFAHNYGRLVALLPAPLAAHFALASPLSGLEAALSLGLQNAEAFYVADGYSRELADVRRELARIDDALRAAERAWASDVESRLGLVFGGRDFLIVSRELIPALLGATTLVEFEPFDEGRLVVRPTAGGRGLQLADDKALLLDRERAEETAVLRALSVQVSRALPALIACRQAAEAFDLAFARARLARELGLSRPRLTSGPTVITGGRFLPCEARCQAAGLTYTPLTVSLAPGAAVLFGSNMGGKTIVLKTAAFLQLCAQTGLYVPAAEYQTRLFGAVHYVGEGRRRSTDAGLSGFGFEIHHLIEAITGAATPTLLLFDELARTTQSREAEAILSAVVEALAARLDVTALLATHFRGVHRAPGAAFYRMGGLDRAGLAGEPKADGLPSQLAAISRRMNFNLQEDDGLPGESDAIAVAGMLGLMPELLRRAESFYQEQ